MNVKGGDKVLLCNKGTGTSCVNSTTTTTLVSNTDGNTVIGDDT